MSPSLAIGIVEYAYDNNKELYRVVLASVAEARKVRPVYIERTPRAKRHADVVSMLSRPRLELVSGNLIRDWLMRKHRAMLCDFLDTLGVVHKEGTVDELPTTVPDEKVQAAVEKILSQYPPEEVAVYLNAFYSMNEVQWPALETLLKNDSRLQFGG